jgi:hypothetical protein
MENQERISSLSIFSPPPPLASFLTNQSPGNLNFLDSINTTPVLNQSNISLNSTDRINSSLADTASVSTIASETAICAASNIGALAEAIVVPPVTSKPPKRKYSELQKSGKQKKHHTGPIDTSTLKCGAALAQSKSARIDTLFNKSTQLHDLSRVDVTIIIRDQEN